MTGLPALQDVPLDWPVSAHAAALTTRVLDTGTPLDDALSMIAEHLLTIPRVAMVSAALTTLDPEDETRWTRLGQRAWVTEWLRPGTTCSLPDAGSGAEAALTLPWVSQRARDHLVALVDTELLPTEADQDRSELTSCGVRSIVVAAHACDGVMYGSLAMGSPGPGPWPPTHVADFRLLKSALTSRIALEHARRSVADSVAAGAQTREAQQHFFAAVGHELRTPLAAVVGYTEMLVDEAAARASDPFAGSVVRDGAVILRACEHLGSVVEELLSAGRTLGAEEVSSDVDVAAAVDDVLHWHGATARGAGVELTSTVVPGQTVWAHPAGVRQVLANLIGNAVVHNVPQGSVVVSSRTLTGETGEPRLRVIVRDTGPGLTQEQLEHVFDPFVRYAGPEVKGTGLGLSLSRTVAERGGGTVGAESAVGQGSAFWVELPVRRAGPG